MIAYGAAKTGKTHSVLGSAETISYFLNYVEATIGNINKINSC